MEKHLKIKTPDNKIVYGTLRGPLSDKLVIFVHGLAGHKDEHIFFNGAKFLEENQLSSFRFNLYNWHDGARSLIDCTLKIHGQDLDTVIAYFRRRGVKTIFVIGHSYGGPSILHSQNKDFEGVIFWDASHHLKRPFTDAKFSKELNSNVMNWGISILIGEEMVTESDKLNCNELIKKITAPIKIIIAGKGILIPGGKRYY